MVGFRKGRRRAWSWAALALAVVGTAGVGIWGVAASRSRVASVARGVRSIAVLPLRNLSDPSQANFADGMTEELIATLTQIRSLRVVSATSIMRYRDRQVPLRQIASDLGVDAVIDGTLQRDGDRVRVNAQLIDARTDTHLWAHVYDERLADVLALQSKLARAIASQVEIQLSPQETTRLAAVRTVNSAAYDEILLGQAYRWRQTEDLPRALEHYQRAVALDPQSAVAYAGLAATWTLIDEPAARAAARAAALRAVALDMELPEAHAALAAVKYRDWDWEGGDTESRLALAGSPGALDSCFCYGLMLSVTGRLSESLTVADEAILRNPLSGAAHQVKGIALLYARRYNEAEAALRRGLNVDPGFRGNSRLLAQVLIASGRAQEAVALLEQEAKSSALTRLNLAVAYASAGRGPEALQLLAQITASNPAPEAITVAKIHLALGDRRSGLQWLERSADRHEVRTPYLLQPAFDAIRREPRFRALVARLRFPSQFEAFEATVTPR
jgi:TolB-like protein/Tfp pilus assembly protein PilF